MVLLRRVLFFLNFPTPLFKRSIFSENITDLAGAVIILVKNSFRCLPEKPEIIGKNVRRTGKIYSNNDFLIINILD